MSLASSLRSKCDLREEQFSGGFRGRVSAITDCLGVKRMTTINFDDEILVVWENKILLNSPFLLLVDAMKFLIPVI